jgi:uncharacterized protein YjbI with pentapeptide repeats
MARSRPNPSITRSRAVRRLIRRTTQSGADWVQIVTALGTPLTILVAVAALWTSQRESLKSREIDQSQVELTQQGQITDRFTRAVDQLGSGKSEIEIGGMYALERIMRDSATDRPAVVSVLSAYIVTHAVSKTAKDAPTPALRIVLNILARRPAGGADLRNANLSNAGLTAANLVNADLSGADLSGAHLSDGELYYANLFGADLTGAHLTNAHLTQSRLQAVKMHRADLTNAYLAQADLIMADLTNAGLREAELIEADLSNADLTGADLTGAKLTDADLTNAILTDADLTDADLTGANLTGATVTGCVGCPRPK